MCCCLSLADRCVLLLGVGIVCAGAKGIVCAQAKSVHLARLSVIADGAMADAGLGVQLCRTSLVTPCTLLNY
jgi:hypothetical protein